MHIGRKCILSGLSVGFQRHFMKCGASGGTRGSDCARNKVLPKPEHRRHADGKGEASGTRTFRCNLNNLIKSQVLVNFIPASKISQLVVSGAMTKGRTRRSLLFFLQTSRKASMNPAAHFRTVNSFQRQPLGVLLRAQY